MVPLAKRGPHQALTKCRTQAACAPVVILLGTKRDCRLRCRGRFDLTPTKRDSVHMPQEPPGFCSLMRRPSLSSRVYTGPKTHCQSQSARPSPQAPSCDLDDCERSKTSQVLANETGTLAQHPQPKEHTNHLPHERWSPKNNRAVNSMLLLPS